jgi:stage II sporulation protein E
MGLIGGEYAYLMGAYALGGLLAGAFRGAGKFGVAAAFVVVGGIAAAMAGLGGGQLSPLYEAFIVSVLFMLTPQRLLNRLRWNPAGAASGVDQRHHQGAAALPGCRGRHRRLPRFLALSGRSRTN